MTFHPSAAPAGAGAFAASDDGARWTFSGELTMDTAAAALESARSLPLPSSGAVDFSALTHADSAALSVMIALKRRGVSEGRALVLTGVPSTLTSLAVVYGVDTLLAA